MCLLRILIWKITCCLAYLFLFFLSWFRDALLLIQWHTRAFMALKNWPWMRLFFKIKPPVKSATMGKEIAGLKNECVQVQKALEKLKFQRAKQVSLIKEKNDLLFSCQLWVTSPFVLQIKVLIRFSCFVRSVIWKKMFCRHMFFKYCRFSSNTMVTLNGHFAS